MTPPISLCFLQILLLFLVPWTPPSSATGLFSFGSSNTNNNGSEPLDPNEDMALSTTTKSSSQNQNEFGVCGSSKTCQDCSRSAAAMLKASNGEYTCLWKQQQQQSTSFGATNKKDGGEGFMMITCALIPFSNTVISTQGISCSDAPQQNTLVEGGVDPTTGGIRGSSTSALTGNLRTQRKRKKNIFHVVFSTGFITCFFVSLFRLRAFVLGQRSNILPDFILSAWRTRTKSHNPSSSISSSSHHYLNASQKIEVGRGRSNGIGIRSHTRPMKHKKDTTATLSDEKIKESMIALRSRGKGGI